jgi:putative SOS response-associated peptidase YedK
VLNCRDRNEGRQAVSPCRIVEKLKDRKAGIELLTFAVITTDPNEVVEQLHDMMPCIIPEKDYDRWLKPGDPDRSPIDLLRPFDPSSVRADRRCRRVWHNTFQTV